MKVYINCNLSKLIHPPHPPLQKSTEQPFIKKMRCILGLHRLNVMNAAPLGVLVSGNVPRHRYPALRVQPVIRGNI